MATHCGLALIVSILFSASISSALQLALELLIAMPFNIFETAEFEMWAACERFQYGYRSLLTGTTLVVLLLVTVSIASTWLIGGAGQKAVVKACSQLVISVPIVTVLLIRFIRGSEHPFSIGHLEVPALIRNPAPIALPVDDGAGSAWRDYDIRDLRWG